MLIHDFSAPYDSVLPQDRGDHQRCPADLLRELDEVDLRRPPGKAPEAARDRVEFAKMPKRLVRDGVLPALPSRVVAAD